MANTIDSKVVEMYFDNRQFEAGVSQSMGTLDKLKASLRFDGLENSLSIISNSFTAFGTIIHRVLENVADMAFNTGRQLISSLTVDNIVDGWEKYAEITKATQTIMAATKSNWTSNKDDLKDETKQMAFVNDELKKLNWFTDETSYNLTDMTGNIGKFTSAGIKLEAATNSMMGVAAWAGISGANAQQASRAMYNLSQAMAMGSLRIQDWMSIENANMATKEFKDQAIAAGVACGTLKKGAKGAVYATDRFGKAIKVTNNNFRSTLNTGWFNTSVINKVLGNYGNFSAKMYEYLSAETDAGEKLLNVSTSQLLKYVGEVKNGELKITDSKGNLTDSFKNLAKDLNVDAQALADTLKELSKSSYDLGFRAFKASQEAKTFQEAVMYAKDAASTGWMNTFRTIFGDYEQSKKLWTQVTEEFYDLFLEDLDNQNNVLARWAELGGRTVLMEAVQEAWTVIKDTIFTIKDTFKEVFPPATGETIKKITDNFKTFTYIMGTTESKMEKVRDVALPLFEGLKRVANSIKNVFGQVKKALNDNELLPKDIFKEGNLVSSLKFLVDEFYKLAYVFEITENKAKPFYTTFYNIFAGIKNIVTSIKNLIPTVGKAWTKIFPPQASNILEMLSTIFLNLTEAFKITEERAGKLQRLFEGLFAVLDIIRMAVTAVIEPFVELSGSTNGVADGIFNAAESLGNWLIGIRDWIKENDSFRKIVKTIADFFKDLPAKIDKASVALTGLHTGELWEKMKQDAQSAWEVIKKVFGEVREYLSKVFGWDEAVKKADGDYFIAFLETIKNLIDKIKEGFNALKPYLDQVWDYLKQNIDLKELLNPASVAKFMKELRKVLKLFPYIAMMVDLFNRGRITTALVDMLNSVGGVFQSLQKSIQVKSIKTIASAILEIAAAIFILSLLPEDKVDRSVAVVGGLMTAITGFVSGMVVASRFADDKALAQVNKIITGMEVMLISISASIFAIAKYTDVDKASLAARMIAELMAESTAMIALTTRMSWSEKDAANVQKTFLSISAMILAIGGALALATMNGDWSSIASAGTVMSGMLFAIAGAMRIMPTEKDMKSIGLGMTLVGTALALIGAGIMMATQSGDLAAIAVAGTIMAGMLFAMAGALKMLSEQEDILKSAAALTILAAGISLIGFALSQVATLDLSQVAMSVIAIAAALVILLAAGAIAEKVSIGLVALGGAIALIGVGVAAAGAGMWLFAEAIEKIVSLGSEGISTFINGIVEFFQNLPEMATNAGVAIVNFMDALGNGKDSLAKGFTSVLSAIIESIRNIFPQLNLMIQEFLLGGLETLEVLFPKIHAFIVKVVIAGIESLREIFPHLNELIKELLIGGLQTLKAVIPELNDTLMTVTMNALRHIRDNAEEIIQIATEIAIFTVTGVIKGLTAQLPNIVETGWQFVITFINSIADGVDAHAEELKAAITHLCEALLNGFRTFFGIHSPSTVFSDLGTNLIQGLINGISSMIESAKKMITQLADKVLTAICDFFGVDKPSNANELMQLGTKLIQKFNAGIYSMIEKAKSMITQLADKVLTAICDFFGINKPKDKQEFYKLGLNIINAFKNAISSLTGKVKDAVAGVANSAVEKFKSVLGIHSPSTVFTAFGRFIDEGLALGLEKFAGGVANSAEYVGNTAINTMSGILDGIADIISGDFAEPTITPILDLSNVTDGLNTVDGMLAANRTMELSSYTGTNVNSQLAEQMQLAEALDNLKSMLSGKDGKAGTVINNEFHISGNNPKEIADEVCRIIQVNVERTDAAWGR